MRGAIAIQNTGRVGAKDHIVAYGNRGRVGKPSDGAFELHATHDLRVQGRGVAGQLNLCGGENARAVGDTQLHHALGVGELGVQVGWHLNFQALDLKFGIVQGVGGKWHADEQDVTIGQRSVVGMDLAVRQNQGEYDRFVDGEKA